MMVKNLKGLMVIPYFEIMNPKRHHDEKDTHEGVQANAILPTLKENGTKVFKVL